MEILKTPDIAILDLFPDDGSDVIFACVKNTNDVSQYFNRQDTKEVQLWDLIWVLMIISHSGIELTLE